MKKSRNRSANLFTQLFSEPGLVVLVSLITLLLQIISFATTWNGSRVYLEGVFPFASLLFAIAIQTTAYFFSNSLRTKVSALKVLALGMALCCSTYYSYIGIYNSVNSPATYLQQNYVRICDELNDIYEETLEENLSRAQSCVDTAFSQITTVYTALESEQSTILACRGELSDTEISISSGMRPPRRDSYENYEDYVAAYNAYIAGMASGTGVEQNASQSNILNSYGFSDIERLNEAERDNNARIRAMEAVLDGSGNSSVSFRESLSDLYLAVSDTISGASLGQSPDNRFSTQLNRLFHLAQLDGNAPSHSTPETDSAADIVNTLRQCATAASSPLLTDYGTLILSLEGGSLTDANLSELKSAMDREILNALIGINSLLPDTERIASTDPRFVITDLYLIPIQALTDESTRTTALFCFAVAALIDTLSVVFAVSLKGKKPLWKKHFLLRLDMEELAPYLCAALPQSASTGFALADFLSHFVPSPDTESDGYMLRGIMDTLDGYYPLTALLCQLNLAKILPPGFHQNEEECLLLKARFVLWANTLLQGERKTEVLE